MKNKKKCVFDGLSNLNQDLSENHLPISSNSLPSRIFPKLGKNLI